MKTIGDRIKRLRKELDLTQMEFSKRLLISQSYLSGIEKGNETPTDKLQKLICLEFGVNQQWLSEDKGSMFDDVYENNKAVLAEVSNDALLGIMKLLSTPSSVEYGFYAYILNTFVIILGEGKHFDNEDAMLRYLDLLQILMDDFLQMIQFASLKPKSVVLRKERSANANIAFLEKYRKGVIEDLSQLSDFFIQSDSSLTWTELLGGE